MLADEGFAEERGHPADVGPEFGGEIGAGMHCSVSHGNNLSRGLGSYTALDTVSRVTFFPKDATRSRGRAGNPSQIVSGSSA